MIYNPAAGKLRNHPERILQPTIEALAAARVEPRLVPTTGPRTATALARQAVEDGAGLVIVLGGDGTINEVMNGVVYSQAAMAILPAGTANVLANELGLPARPDRAAGRLAEFVPERISVGRLHSESGETRHFLLMAGVGLDARIVFDVHAGYKAMAGRLAYWVAGLRQLSRSLEEFDVRLNDRSFHCSFVLASRVRNYGGALEIARSASLLQDDFEVVLFEGANPLRYVKYLLGVLVGNVGNMRGVRVLHSRHLEFSGAAHVQIDGEYVGRLPVTIEIIPRALTLLVPPDVRERIPARVLPSRHPVWITSPTR